MKIRQFIGDVIWDVKHWYYYKLRPKYFVRITNCCDAEMFYKNEDYDSNYSCCKCKEPTYNYKFKLKMLTKKRKNER